MDRLDTPRHAVAAISYDPVATLASFGEQFGIGYPLLSDAGSTVIRALGLENRHVEAYNRRLGIETSAKHVGLPHPGTYELDSDGLVVAKHFAQLHRERPSATVLLADELRGQGADEQVTDRAVVSGVPVSARLATTTYHPLQLLECRVRLSVPTGRHIYVGDVPSGFTTLRVELSGPGSLAVEDMSRPSGHPLRIEELNEEFTVVEGDIEIVVPLRLGKDEGDVDLVVTVALQSCSDTDCFAPAEGQLSLPLRSGGLLRPS